MLDRLKRTRRAVYREIVRKDCYLVRKYFNDSIDYIFDIGANVGIFTLLSNFIHPTANIVAYEPCKYTFDYLIDNAGYIDNVEFRTEALGDGSMLYLYDTGYSGCNLFYKENETDNEVDNTPTKSVLLSDIIRSKIKLNSNYFIKMDCEGGERFLLNDRESINVITESIQTAIEVHFPPVGCPVRREAAERFKTFPRWEIYNAWINDNFNKTHDIIYHCSSRKNGTGVYVLHGKHR